MASPDPAGSTLLCVYNRAIMRALEISTDEFRRLSQTVTDLASEYLTGLSSRQIFPNITGAQSEETFSSQIPENGMGNRALDDLKKVVEFSRAQNGRFFGYVLGSGDPVAATADLLAGVLNQNVTAWRSGPAAVTLERMLVSWLAEAIGCSGFQGSLTGGGSSANLMGLAMAREAKLPSNETGIRGQPVVYASEEIHMSIPKSIALLGIGRNHLRRIATDDGFHMRPSALEDAIRCDHAEGKTAIAIVASAGTVNTGAIDPLEEISAIARKHGIWLHVDGAYGALAAIAAPEKFRGLNLADSLSLDPHKWLYQPLDCGCLLYRDPLPARTAFAHTGDYAKALSVDPIEGFAFFEESMELSRRFRALRLWLSLRYHGLRAFRASIQKDLELAGRLSAAVQAHPKFDLIGPSELSAVCFRYKGSSTTSDVELDRQNAEILKHLQARGRIYLSNATLRGMFYLRACIVNHRTSEADIDAVIPEVLAAAAELGF